MAIIMSHKPRNENPRNNPRAPPTSATNEVGGYIKASSFTVISVVE